MTILASALVLLGLLLVLLAGGVWIAISLAVVAWAGLQFLTSSPPDVNLFQSFWGSSASWTLAALPLFVWMGEILYRTRLSQEMFEGLAPWLGWLPGRLMHVNILGCAIFGTVSGSSTATCATIAKVSLPELKKRGYDEKSALARSPPPARSASCCRRPSSWSSMRWPPKFRSSRCSSPGSSRGLFLRFSSRATS